MIFHLIKKRAKQPFSQKHKAFYPLDIAVNPTHPTCLTCSQRPKIWKATPAGQDMQGEGKEGFIIKFTAIWRVKGGRGRGREGQRLVPKEGSEACTVAEKIENSFDFFFNVKYFGGESEIF